MMDGWMGMEWDGMRMRDGGGVRPGACNCGLQKVGLRSGSGFVLLLGMDAVWLGIMGMGLAMLGRRRFAACSVALRVLGGWSLSLRDLGDWAHGLTGTREIHEPVGRRREGNSSALQQGPGPGLGWPRSRIGGCVIW